MSHRLSQSYLAFTGKPWPGAAALPQAAAASKAKALPASAASMEFVSRLADPNHSILIRALLDRESLPGARPAGGFEGLSAGPSAYAMIRDRSELIREETAFKFIEFRDRWRKRLAFIQLGSFLQRNQWFQQNIDGWSLAGKGTRKDAKMLYLQSLHDMASDCERQVSFLGGHMFRLQGELAAIWHQESVRTDRSKLLPALEAALRGGEADLFKRLRLSLGDLAQVTFTERVVKWDKRVHGDEGSLFKSIAWPWEHARYRSGFEGFMETFADLSEAMCAFMLAHYEAKWDLFLRGLAPLQQALSLAAPAQSAQVQALPQ